MPAGPPPPIPAHFTEADGLWVFAYGSLMWRPEFEVEASYKAQLDGFHRDFCISSIVYRGTKESPGLVLGLDHGGRCEGVVFKIKTGMEQESLEAIRKREQPNQVYLELIQSVTLLNPLQDSPALPEKIVNAVCYVADTTHEQYRANLSYQDKAEIINRAHGGAGPNIDYLANTLSHLDELDIDDPLLTSLMALTKC